MKCKFTQYEAVTAIDRRSNRCNGILEFSRNNNRITFFSVSSITKYNETAEKLLLVARSASFHYNYSKFIQQSKKEYGPCILHTEVVDRIDMIYKDEFPSAPIDYRVSV